MRLIINQEELKENLEIFEKYLCEGSREEQEFIEKRIAGGACFVSYKVSNEWRFAPSRFIGYYKNDIKKHNENNGKDGRITNPAIDKIAENKLEKNANLETEYLTYCKLLGIKPHNKTRKFWLFNFDENDLMANYKTNDAFPEGKLIERRHIYRERNATLIELVKNNYKITNGNLSCQICNFNFEEFYGSIGENFIEAHHTIPVSEMGLDHETSIEEIALVCSNCHRMLHRKRPWLNIHDLKKLLSK